MNCQKGNHIMLLHFPFLLLSSVELISSQNQAKEDKRKLRRVLKEFEDNFFQETGRRVQREDRTPMETEYHEYKVRYQI